MPLTTARSALRFLGWKLRHPFQPFSAYYTNRVSAHLSSGQAHGTLGSRIRNPSQYRESAEAYFELFREAGLTPEDRVIDYGCGSLRIGSVLIPFLDPGHYHGLDTSERFFQDALSRLPGNLRQEKRPQCGVIDRKSITHLAAKIRPTFLISTHVLIHIPRKELPGFFTNISSLISSGGLALVDFIQSSKPTRFHELTWSYPLDLLVSEASKQRLETVVVDESDSPALVRLKGFYGNDFTMVKFTRKPDANGAH